MDISSEYINIPIEKVSQSVNKSLKEMSEFVHADRAYIFRYDFAEKPVQMFMNTAMKELLRK